MRPHHTPRKRRDAGAKDHPTPARFLHGRHTQLGEQIRGAAIGAPGVFEDLDRDVGDVIDGMGASGQAGIVEEDGGRAHFPDDVAMEVSDAGVGAEVGLEMLGGHVVFGAEVGDEGVGGGSGGVEVDGDGAAEGGEGETGGGADAACGSCHQGKVVGEVFGEHDCCEGRWRGLRICRDDM